MTITTRHARTAGEVDALRRHWIALRDTRCRAVRGNDPDLLLATVAAMSPAPNVTPDATVMLDGDRPRAQRFHLTGREPAW